MRGAQRSMVQNAQVQLQRAALPNVLQFLDVRLRIIYLKAWTARIMPYQSQKTVRTLCILGDVVRTALLLHVRYVLSIKITGEITGKITARVLTKSNRSEEDFLNVPSCCAWSRFVSLARLDKTKLTCLRYMVARIYPIIGRLCVPDNSPAEIFRQTPARRRHARRRHHRLRPCLHPAYSTAARRPFLNSFRSAAVCRRRPGGVAFRAARPCVDRRRQ